jgi:peroxiredoxin
MRRLTGKPMQSVRLYRFGREPMELNQIALGWVVYYLYPGTDAAPAAGSVSPAEDAAQHIAFAAYADEFAANEARVVGISAQTTEEQHRALKSIAVNHEMRVDPGLVLADALGLPIFEHAGRRWYRRLTLLTKHGVIEAVFYPVEDAATGPRQILTWMQLHA